MPTPLPTPPQPPLGTESVPETTPQPDDYMKDLFTENQPDPFAAPPQQAPVPQPTAPPQAVTLQQSVALQDPFAAMAQPMPASQPIPPIAVPSPQPLPPPPAPLPPVAPVPEPAPQVDVWSTQPQPQMRKPVALPDFTDEDIAALEQLVPKRRAPEPLSAPELAPEPTPIPKAEAPVPVVMVSPPPAPVSRAPPAPKAPDLYLGADEYFIIVDELRAARRTLRKSDDALRTAQLRHEQMDEQVKHVAADVNNIQERLMEIDEALFGN